MPYLDALQIIDAISDWFFDTPVTENLDLITFALFIICLGWVIYSLANKEA